jgi:glycosyltransferase involved in cell wall biosynthesis
MLVITHLFPYPPNVGGRIAILNSLKYLSRTMEIVLVSLVDSESIRFVDEVKQYCLDVKVHQIWTSPYMALARGLTGQPPGTAAKYYDPKFGRLIQKTIKEWSVDLVELQHLNTAAYRPWVGCTPVILREHNVEYKVWERQAEHSNSIWERIYISLVAPRVRAYEGRLAPQFERCITVSQVDASYLRDVAPAAKIEVLPFGVDTEYFVPDDRVAEDPDSIVLTGSFGWKPKQHNLRVLVSEIYPRIKAKLPSARLTVVGDGVPEEIRRLAGTLPGVTLTGGVPDVRPYVHKAALALNYLESGGGIALKVLEAMAMNKPVLSNSLGCEGIKVRHGENVFLADGVESFAGAAVLMLQNAPLRQRIAASGHQLVKESYGWERLVGRFEKCYMSVISESTPEPEVAIQQGSVAGSYQGRMQSAVRSGIG